MLVPCRLLWIAAALWSGSSAYSQTVTATLLGTVTDPAGAAIVGARVTATEINTQVSVSRDTNPSGNYEFPYLKPGLYRITVEMAGFKREVRENLDVVVDTTFRADMKLQVGDVKETVLVTAEIPVLQTDRSDTGRRLEEILLAEMPLGVNRNFQSLLDLVPGTTEASFQHSQFFNAT